jgi:hypothetical protein
VVCIIAMNDALRELRPPNEDAHFGMDGRSLFQLRRSTVAAIGAHAWHIAIAAQPLSR